MGSLAAHFPGFFVAKSPASISIVDPSGITINVLCDAPTCKWWTSKKPSRQGGKLSSRYCPAAAVIAAAIRETEAQKAAAVRRAAANNATARRREQAIFLFSFMSSAEALLSTPSGWARHSSNPGMELRVGGPEQQLELVGGAGPGTSHERGGGFRFTGQACC